VKRCRERDRKYIIKGGKERKRGKQEGVTKKPGNEE
jgi:hypothetical protein